MLTNDESPELPDDLSTGNIEEEIDWLDDILSTNQISINENVLDDDDEIIHYAEKNKKSKNFKRCCYIY